MARASISLTEGSGAKKTATEERTVSSVVVQSQYVILDEPAAPTYSVVATGISAATTADHVLQIMAGSSSYVRVHSIRIEQRGAASGAAVMGVALYRLTTAGSGGTSITPRPFDTADTAAATAMSLPSSKGTEGSQLWQWELEAEQTRPYLGVATWETSPRCKPIIIPAGTANGLAIKVVAGVASVTLTVNVLITETAWL